MNLITPDFGLIFWQTITFLTVLIILKKFAWQKILTTIKDREKSINEALKAAEKAKLSIEQLKLNNEILIKEANLERDKILKDAISVKKSMIENAEKEAKNVKSKIMLDSKISINREKKLAIIALKNYSAELSLKIAKKLLRRELSNEKSQKDLINSILNKK